MTAPPPKRRHGIPCSQDLLQTRYWIASILTKVPVMPTAFGTVIDRKKVARLLFAAAAAIRSVRTFSMMWMPLSVSNSLVHREGFGRCPRRGSPRPPRCRCRPRPLSATASHAAADLLMPGSPLL